MVVRPTRVRRLRIRRALNRALLAVVVLAAGLLYVSVRSQGVTLVVDGRPLAVPSTDGTVEQLLNDHGIEIDAADDVEPPVSTPVADGMTVVVDLNEVARAGVGDPGVWVVEGAERGRMRLASLLAEESPLEVGSVGRSSIHAAEVVVMGKERDVLTNAATVGELLSAMGNKPEGDDRVLPPPSSPVTDRMQVRFTDVEVVRRTIQKEIPFEISETFTTELDPGDVEVVRPGRVGFGRITYEIRRVDGEVVSRKIVGKAIRKEPVNEKRVYGQVVPVSSSPSANGGPATGGAGTESGQATWYDPPWSGLTAAHKTLPFGTQVTVTNLANGESVVVTINDRGPYAPGRVIDLSPEAFAVISDLGTGVLNVRISW